MVKARTPRYWKRRLDWLYRRQANGTQIYDEKPEVLAALMSKKVPGYMGMKTTPEEVVELLKTIIRKEVG